MRVIDPNVLPSNPAHRALLVAHVNGNPRDTFDEIRLAVPGLSALNDGELHQVAIDAGLEVIGN